MNKHYEVIAENISFDNYNNEFDLHERFKGDILKNINNLDTTKQTEFLVWYKESIKTYEQSHYVLIVNNIIDSILEKL